MFGGDPGGFRKVWEADRKNFLLFSSQSDSMVPSYGEAKNKVAIRIVTTLVM